MCNSSFLVRGLHSWKTKRLRISGEIQLLTPFVFGGSPSAIILKSGWIFKIPFCASCSADNFSLSTRRE